jgi:hypothetical protein
MRSVMLYTQGGYLDAKVLFQAASHLQPLLAAGCKEHMHEVSRAAGVAAI